MFATVAVDPSPCVVTGWPDHDSPDVSAVAAASLVELNVHWSTSNRSYGDRGPVLAISTISAVEADRLTAPTDGFIALEPFDLDRFSSAESRLQGGIHLSCPNEVRTGFLLASELITMAEEQKNAGRPITLEEDKTLLDAATSPWPGDASARDCLAGDDRYFIR